MFISSFDLRSVLCEERRPFLLLHRRLRTRGLSGLEDIHPLPA
nr:MAG TPA: hypothetical protein [Microviridae sp.]